MKPLLTTLLCCLVLVGCTSNLNKGNRMYDSSLNYINRATSEIKLSSKLIPIDSTKSEQHKKIADSLFNIGMLYLDSMNFW